VLLAAARQIEGTGEIVFGGPSSADVKFGASTDAILKLENPSMFTGTGFGLTTGAYLDLTNINFADNPTISYWSKTIFSPWPTPFLVLPTPSR
jgi:hypothetical protein